MKEAWRDEKRYRDLAETLYTVGDAFPTPEGQKIALKVAVRKIDHSARIEECEELLVQLSEVQFDCRCRSGQHPPSCPSGWARARRAALQHKIDALRQAQEANT